MMSDLIKRSDAIRALHKHFSSGFDADRWWNSTTVLFALNSVPSADIPQEWIPCSERLPEIGQKVLASTKKTVFTQVFKGYYSEPKRWMWEHNSVKTIEAWMPLPKPWKGADDE